MSKKGKVWLIAAIVVVILAAAIAGVITISERNLEKLSAMVIEDVDLDQVSDGMYIGDYSAFPVAVQVDVTVKDHAITGINLVKHQNGQGGSAEVIPQMVVDAQSLQVDTISGATYSSKVILLAIHDALQSAARE